MKQCPVCGALSFDDAEWCFECLEGFSSQEMPAAAYEAEHERELAAVLAAASEMSGGFQGTPTQNLSPDYGEAEEEWGLDCLEEPVQEMLSTGTFAIKTTNAPEDALEICITMNGAAASYFKALAKASSA